MDANGLAEKRGKQMEKILEVKDISKKFGPVTVFHDVNLDLYRGEVLALAGENGAGKSTLMNVLGGVYPAGEYEGEIYVEGKLCRFRGERESKDAGIEMIHQEISLHLELTVAENIFLGNLSNHGGIVNWKSVYQEAQTYLDMVKLEADPKEKVRNLSTSQQQLLSIAKALACHPKILLFDEPTSALTEADAQNLMGIIRRLAGEGISCIYISHRLEEIMELADRVAVLRDGNLISVRPRSEAAVEQIIEDMVGRRLEEMYPKQAVPIGETELEVRNLTVPHPYILNKNIVEDMNFAVAKGEILGISGLVGAGRSETVNAVFGSMKKTTGDILLEGRPLQIKRPLDAIRCGIGLVTEDRKQSGIIAPMCLRENMTIASLNAVSRKGIFNRKRERDMAEEYYGKLQVKAGGIEDNIMNLSGGNQQKIVLSKWLMKDIKVLFLDEPTRGVDVGAKVEIYHIITDLARRGVAVVMISSELPELLGMCDRILVFARGKLWGNIRREDFSQERIMRAATGIEKYGV